MWTVYLFVSTFFAVCLITKKLFLNIHLSWTVPTLCCTATEGDPEGGPDDSRWIRLTFDDLGGPGVEYVGAEEDHVSAPTKQRPAAPASGDAPGECQGRLLWLQQSRSLQLSALGQTLPQIR